MNHLFYMGGSIVHLISPTYVGPPILPIPGNAVLFFFDWFLYQRPPGNPNAKCRPKLSPACPSGERRVVGGWVFSPRVDSKRIIVAWPVNMSMLVPMPPEGALFEVWWRIC